MNLFPKSLYLRPSTFYCLILLILAFVPPTSQANPRWAMTGHRSNTCNSAKERRAQYRNPSTMTSQGNNINAHDQQQVPGHM
jgi:hypothetical protein